MLRKQFLKVISISMFLTISLTSIYGNTFQNFLAMAREYWYAGSTSCGSGYMFMANQPLTDEETLEMHDYFEAVLCG